MSVVICKSTTNKYQRCRTRRDAGLKTSQVVAWCYSIACNNCVPTTVSGSPSDNFDGAIAWWPNFHLLMGLMGLMGKLTASDNRSSNLPCCDVLCWRKPRMLSIPVFARGFTCEVGFRFRLEWTLGVGRLDSGLTLDQAGLVWTRNKLSRFNCLRPIQTSWDRPCNVAFMLDLGLNWVLWVRFMDNQERLAALQVQT